MYQKLIDHTTGTEATCIKRLADNAFIPFCEDNTDYQKYLEWLDAGNTPLPAEGNEPLPPTEENSNAT